MNNSNNYQQQQSPVVVPPQGQPQQQGVAGAMGYNFSPDELRVLKECNSESFWLRSLPIGTSLGVSTWMLVQRGYIAGHMKFGAAPKVALACIVGYFLGKFSYQQRCAEKIMQLPDSKLAEALRRKKKGEFFENIRPDGGLTMAPFSSGNAEVYTDENMGQKGQNSSLDLDVNRPYNALELDDTYRPSIDSPDRSFNDNLPLAPPQSTTTYEELRKQNRAEYDKKIQNPYYRPITEDAPTVMRAPQPSASQQNEPQGPKNIYGDVWSK